MTPHQFALVTLSLLLLTDCNCTEDSKKLNESTFKQTSKYNRWKGEWVYNIPFFDSKLTLSEDSTFKFHDKGHYGQNYTEGNWIENDNGIVLTSYESFISEIISERNMTILQNNNVRPAKVPAPILPETNDTVRVYFKDVVFKLHGDTLLNLGDNTTKNEYRFVRTKNNR